MDLQGVDDLAAAHLLQPVLVLLLRCLWLGYIILLWGFALLQAQEIMAMLVLDTAEATARMSSHTLKDASFAHKGFSYKR